jgi:hypothetical protein
LRECVEKVNADLDVGPPAWPKRRSARFLVLHKELDADDGELTRTRKVRRGFIAERYRGAGRRALRWRLAAVHRDAGEVRGRPHGHGEPPTLKIVEAKRFASCRRPHEHGGAQGRRGHPRRREHLAELRRREGDLTDISFDVRKHEVRAIIGPNGAGKSSMLNCINGVYQPQQGSITFKRADLQAHELARRWPRWAWRAPSRTSRSSRA